MTRYFQTVYETATGRIFGTQDHSREGVTLTVDPAHSVIPGESDGGVDYVDISGTPTITARSAITATLDKTSITADGVDTATLSGLPTTCTLNIDGDTVAITDGTLAFTATDPGPYTITIDEVDSLLTRWEVTAE
jgi:hypothetical protein